ncbi:jg6687 [Pararge aegeria aegeria]|uniref:Jg6687 protein n=1 Tax=Pararge aegeria aegeria TaxID=348720 RepID=A0A8S4SI59_9NEOP|nr:jg6687 [Pararge aegeria aegeria]
MSTLSYKAYRDDSRVDFKNEVDYRAFGFDVKDVGSLKAFLGCFNDIGTCNAEAADFKKDMAEAVAQACEKCTEAQKHIFKVFLEAIKEKDPEGYKIFQQKYDPQNKYIAALQTAIAMGRTHSESQRTGDGLKRYSTGTHGKIADREDGRGVAGETILSRLLGLPGQGWRERETDGKGWRRPMPKNGHSN